MKTYNELVDYYRNTTVEQAIEDLYLDLIHRTETINKLSRKIQKLRKRIKREQELKEYQYSLKESAIFAVSECVHNSLILYVPLYKSTLILL